MTPCSVCGESAVTIMYDTTVASTISPPILGYYCAEHNPLPTLFSGSFRTEDVVTGADFKWFLDLLFYRKGLHLADFRSLLDSDDLKELWPKTLRRWFEEWMEE